MYGLTKVAWPDVQFFNMVDGVLCTVSRVRLELSVVRSDLADFVSFTESAVYCMSTLTMLSMSTVQSI